jgi:hypothetical protein
MSLFNSEEPFDIDRQSFEDLLKIEIKDKLSSKLKNWFELPLSVRQAMINKIAAKIPRFLKIACNIEIGILKGKSYAIEENKDE